MFFSIDDKAEVLIFVQAILFNILMAILPAVMIFCMIRYPKFAQWVKEIVEDGDQKGNHKDAVNAVILFFAYIVGWLIITMVLAQALADKDWRVLTGMLMGLFLGLLGLKKFH